MLPQRIATTRSIGALRSVAVAAPKIAFVQRRFLSRAEIEDPDMVSGIHVTLRLCEDGGRGVNAVADLHVHRTAAI